MSRDHLTQAQRDALGYAKRATAIRITLGDGTILRFSTGAYDVAGETYLAKLAPVDALNLELTSATEGVELKIANLTLALGQNLINTPDLISGTSAVLQAYFYDAKNNLTWLDDKIAGEIQIGEIDADWVKIFFIAKPDATLYDGVAVAEKFPEEAVPAAARPVEPPAPINDILERRDGSDLRWGDALIGRGRYVLPDLVA